MNRPSRKDPLLRRSSLVLSGVLLFLLPMVVSCGASGSATNPDVILATTTSTQDSGLLDELLPVFEAQTGYRVKAIAVGTGEALQMGRQGDADVLLVHAPRAEQEFIASGAGGQRALVMHNDFLIVGPPGDPARLAPADSAEEAFRRIATKEALFVSRGDDSGTHKKELALWQLAGIQKPQGDWYQESGSGMGQTLRIASEKKGYTLTDRGTYLALRGTLDLKVVAEQHPPLLNPYHVIQVNPEKFPRVNQQGAQAFAEFLLDHSTQEMIGQFGREKFGEPLFVPDGGKSEDTLGAE